MAFVAVACAFLLGSIPFGYLVPRLARGVDVRSVGSGNPGFTNVYRAVGPGLGIAVLLADAAKGVFAVLVGRTLAGPNGAVLAGLAAIAGHVATPFLGFRGGKGVATTAGVFFTLLPLEAAAVLALFVVVVGASRYVSLGSVSAAAALPLSILVGDAVRGRPLRTPLFFLALAAAALIVWRHRANLRRLAAGTENRFRFGRGGDS
jgi:glycerol-3-phosphate acyltransferase PlsY